MRRAEALQAKKEMAELENQALKVKLDKAKKENEEIKKAQG